MEPALHGDNWHALYPTEHQPAMVALNCADGEIRDILVGYMFRVFYVLRQRTW